MDVVYERCAGIDISKADVKVCVRIPGAGKGKRRHVEVRTFPALTSGLLAMRDWLLAEGVTVVGMEATGSYWKPVFYLLEHDMECWLLNARHMKAVPGRKTDVKDAEWIAQLVEHGLVRPSFVPPQPIRQLRDLTRYRTDVVRERAREAQRLQNLLEDCGIKLTSVVSDFLGVSGRRMLTALIAGERDPKVLAELAVGRLRGRREVLEEAPTGYFTTHHGFLAQAMLDRIDQATAMEQRLNTQIGEHVEPFLRQIELLATIPGVSAHTAQVILAEIGADITCFPSAGHLASWAGVCPGNHESAGKHTSGRTRAGDPWLKGVLGQAALSASRTKDTYLAARYRRLIGRRGKKRALVALQHSILIAIWHMFTHDVPYADLGGGYFIERTGKTRATRRLVSQLNHLGYQVSLHPVEAT
ncbi:IS110 family transposase [Streptacidiphilus pinicola]|uniref:IS110 family transposase n=1 Tax=Streptacidiphilus pinicola TaxID=2219663 RepID=A0A2X0K818_9ACTN|nr:IS110 family transposase [Streptacidiphilus pinicola]RAG83360.1 IS110 family transposase [Streptacidiphilus pinicola]